MRQESESVLSQSNQNLNRLILCRATTQVSTELDGETVILDVASGIYSGLDPVGTMIWNLLERPITFADIVETVLDTYDVQEEQCVKEMLVFLQDLASHGLLSISDETAA
jgi:hypothetical protein